MENTYDGSECASEGYGGYSCGHNGAPRGPEICFEGGRVYSKREVAQIP